MQVEHVEMPALAATAARMWQARPSPALAPFVESIWYFESAGSFAGAHARERILPQGTMQLLINLDQDELRSYHGDGYAQLHRIRGAGLCGVYARHFAIDVAEQRSIAGVSFVPGGAFPFFAAPSNVVAEDHVELDALWGREGALVRERLLESRSPIDKLRTLEAALLGALARPLERDPAIAFALAAFDRDAAVAAVTDRLGMTPRRFIHRFAEQVGLTPKRYARVRRFQRVLAAVEHKRAVDWAQLAVDCGYFDQAHLIHDFRAFSGMSPTAYHRSEGGRNHVLLPAELGGGDHSVTPSMSSQRVENSR